MICNTEWSVRWPKWKVGPFVAKRIRFLLSWLGSSWTLVKRKPLWHSLVSGSYVLKLPGVWTIRSRSHYATFVSELDWLWVTGLKGMVETPWFECCLLKHTPCHKSRWELLWRDGGETYIRPNNKNIWSQDRNGKNHCRCQSERGGWKNNHSY